jgi:hypothetical protein
MPYLLQFLATAFFEFRNADKTSAQWACQALEGRQAKGPEAR